MSINVCRLTKTELWEVSDIFYNLEDYQAQYVKEGLQVRNNNTGKDYIFHYSNVFSDILKEKHIQIKERGIAFVQWTKTKSNVAEHNRFIRKEYKKSGNILTMDGFPFKQEQATVLDGIIIENREILIPFILEYIRRYSNYRIKDDGSDSPLDKRPIGHKKVWLAPSDGSLSTVEQEMLHNNLCQEIELPAFQQTKKEGKIMNRSSNIANTTVQVNKDAITLAAKLEVGKVATQTIGKAVKKQLPMMIRGYADSPFYNIVIANMAGIALREFAGNNEKAMIVSEAMIQSAAVEMMSSFNIDEMIADMLKDIDVSKLTETKVKD